MDIRPELDGEHKAVLADWLLARGDPRGELISLELALDQPGTDPRPLLARLDSLRAELEPRWVAALADKLELTPAQLHAFMPGRWYAGLLLELCVCPRAELAQGDVATVLFEWILESEASVAVEVIDAGSLPGETVLELLATGPIRDRVHRLVLGDHRSPVGELALLNGQLPGLRELEVRGPGIELVGFEAPALEHLRLCGADDGSGLAPPEGGLRCPALTRLELRFGNADYGGWRQPPPPAVPPRLVPHMLASAELPALRELGLAGMPLDAQHLAEIVATPSFERLRRLSLANLHIGSDELARILAELSEPLARLERLEIGDRWMHRGPFERFGNLLFSP